MQEGATWDYSTMITEPSLALKLYVLFVLLSLLVTAANLIRCWLVLPPFRHKTPKSNSSGPAVSTLRRTALSLRRWLSLNLLAWALVTCSGLLTALRGLAAQKTVGTSLLIWLLYDLLQPLPLFLGVATALYLVRWHILWRVECAESRAELNSTENLAASG
jgi:hypothetical protein